MENHDSELGRTEAQDDERVRARLAAFIDSSDDAIVSKTLDGVITSWNRAAEQLFGYSEAEAVGRHIFLIIPDERHVEEEQVLAHLRRGEKIDHFETVRQAKDGRRVPVSLTVSPIIDSTGRIVGASKVARDISERKHREQLAARLAAIVDSSDDAIVSKTLDGVITSWNRAAEQLFGYSTDEAIGQHIFLIVPDERREEEEDVLRRLRRGEKIDHFETLRRAKDGRLIPISLTVSPLRTADGTIIGASKVARDITDRVRAHEILQRSHDELEQRVRERTAERERIFARLVLAQEDERQRIARELHDHLGQQMTALRLTLETLKALATGHRELHAQIETLQDLATQLDQDISFRVWELTPAVLQGVGLAAALTDYAASWSKRFGIRSEVHAHSQVRTPLSLELETTIYRFAQEALNNVVKHARATRVDIVFEHGPEHVSLIVEDNGVGFNPSATQTTSKGFGLIGMRERAALAGADFQIEAAPGHGTTLMLRVSSAATAPSRSA